MAVLCLTFWGISSFFYSCCTNLHSSQQCMRVPFSPYPPQHLLFVAFDGSHSDRCEWYRIVILICISLMIGDTAHLFMCLLAFCMSSLEKCLFRFSAHSLIRLFVFLMLSYMRCLYICILTLISHIICKYFLPFCMLLFHFVDGFLCCAQAFKFN